MISGTFKRGKPQILYKNGRCAKMENMSSNFRRLYIGGRATLLVKIHRHVVK